MLGDQAYITEILFILLFQSFGEPVIISENVGFVSIDNNIIISYTLTYRMTVG